MRRTLRKTERTRAFTVSTTVGFVPLGGGLRDRAVRCERDRSGVHIKATYEQKPNIGYGGTRMRAGGRCGGDGEGVESGQGGQ